MPHTYSEIKGKLLWSWLRTLVTVIHTFPVSSTILADNMERLKEQDSSKIHNSDQAAVNRNSDRYDGDLGGML